MYCIIDTAEFRFCFRRVPFGITSAPEIFPKKMTDLLDNQAGTKACMDDILIYGANVEEHDHRLNEVLDKVKKVGLQLNRDKCHIPQCKIPYYGHIISGDGVCVNPDKVQAIRELAAPTNLTGLRRTLGMINYLCRFLPELSSRETDDRLAEINQFVFMGSSAKTVILQGDRHVDIDASFSLLRSS